MPRTFRSTTGVRAARWAVMAAVVGLPLLAAAEEEKEERPAFAVFVVDFQASEQQQAWVAEAFEQFAYAELAQFERLQPVYSVKPTSRPGDDEEALAEPSCAERTPQCLVELHGEAGADVVLMGDVVGDSLRYRVYETWTGSQVSHGALTIKRGTDLTRVRQGLLLALNPVIRVGGLLEQRDTLTRGRAQESEGEMKLGMGLVVLLLGCAASLVLPYLLLAFLLRTSLVGALRRGKTWRWAALGVVALVVLAGLAFTGSLVTAFELPDTWSRYRAPGAAILSGIAWGGLVLLFARVGFAPLHGLDHVRVQNLTALLRAWGGVTLLRLGLTALLTLPVAGLVAMVGQGFGLEPRTITMTVAPAVGLFVLFASFIAVDACCLYLDACLVKGHASPDHEHHGALRQYLESYLRRLGVRVPHRLLDRSLLLSGDVPSGVAVYGGALSRPRIVVDTELVDLALGATATQVATTAEPEALDFDGWVSGWMRPGGAPGTETRGPVAHRPLVMAAQGQASLGQHFSLLGFSLPRSSGTEVPPRFERADVSRPNAHYAAREMSLADTDHDQSDPTHRDFLFGPMLHGLGSIMRWDTVLGTVLLSASVFATRRGEIFAKAVDRIRSAYLRTVGRYPTIISDSYPALHHGRDHLIQYLYYRDTGDSSLLTARASQPELFAISYGLWERLAEDKAEGKGTSATKERILWLSHYTYFPVGDYQRPTLRIAGALLALGLVGYLGFLAVSDAMKYSPTYEQRMQEIEQAREASKADQNSKDD